MKLHPAWIAIATTLLILLWFGDSEANPACPLDTLTCYLSSYSTITSTDSVKSCSGRYSVSRYDLIHGVFHVESYPTCGGDCSTAALVGAEDQYHVEGLPPGGPVTFTAEMTIGLRVGGYCANHAPYGSASASLREGAANQSSAAISTPSYTCPTVPCCSPGASANQTLRVTIVRSGGEIFAVHFNLASNGSVPIVGDGQLVFAGLPSGASVISCQGYRQDFVTASLPLSWGRLKLLYR